MIGFEMTQKRLLKMPLTRRHKWMGRWLAGLYRQLLEEEIAQKTLQFAWEGYAQARVWIGMERETEPPQTKAAWLEWLADRFHEHQSQLGLGILEADLLPKMPQGDLVVEGPWEPRHQVWVGLEKIRSAFNLGSIIRTVDALGFAGVILGPDSPAPSSNQVRKTAMGAHQWIPAIQPDDFWGYLSELEIAGFHLVGLEKTDASQHYLHYSWPKKMVLLIGNEEYGLSQEALARTETQVHLPMRGRKNSVNLANAFAAVGFGMAAQLESQNA